MFGESVWHCIYCRIDMSKLISMQKKIGNKRSNERVEFFFSYVYAFHSCVWVYGCFFFYFQWKIIERHTHIDTR